MDTITWSRTIGRAVLCLVLGTIPSALLAQTVLPGTQPGELENWPLLPPSDCKTCHGGYVAGLDYEPFDTWAGSMMANSARDPLFWAAVDIANQDLPGVGEFCIRCHSPRAWLSGRSSTADGSALQGYPDEIDSDYEGIDCHFCHRMYEGEGGTPFTQNGQYWVDDGTAQQEPPRRGPFQQAFAPHPWQYSQYHGESEFCGVCHDLRNPYRDLLDENGVSTGVLFPEQLTYTEWTRSAFATEGTSCQDCHMPPVEQSPAFACNSFNPPRPDASIGDPTPVFRHDLVGANTFMLSVLAGEYGFDLERETAYAYSLSRAREMLQEKSATLSLTPPAVTVQGDTATVDLRVTNLTGHKLPTGYPEGRRMWLHVVATDALGVPFFESGAYDTATATLSEDPQLRVYETKHGVHGGGPGFHLVLNDRIYSDTRIPPRGFRPDPDTAPLGRAYALQPDSTLAHWDDVRYRIPIPALVQSPIRVAATLRYQTASRDYIEFLRDENVSGPDPKDRNYPNAPDRGQKMYDLWSQYGKSTPEDMVEVEAVLAVQSRPANVTAMSSLAGHRRVRLDWEKPPTAAAVTIVRKQWDAYPVFDSDNPALPVPTWPQQLGEALATGWTTVYDGTASSCIDSLFGANERTMVSYAAFAYDGLGVHAEASTTARVRSVNYLLGDLGQVGNPGVYDGRVDGVEDLPVLSLTYGSAVGEPGFDPEADIAPTHDGSSLGRPVPDGSVDFFDLLVFSLRFGAADPTTSAMVLARSEASPEAESAGLLLHLDAGTQRLQVRSQAGATPPRALSVTLPAGTLRRYEPGPAFTDHRLPHFAAVREHRGSTSIDVALLGADARVQPGSVLLELDLTGDSATTTLALLDASAWDLRDIDGRPMQVKIEAEGDLPLPRGGAALELSEAVPNPFNPRTAFELRLARPARVEVSIFDLAGRRVRMLLAADLAEGAHSLVWDGTDDKQQSVASGAYFVRAAGMGHDLSRRLMLIR